MSETTKSRVAVNVHSRLTVVSSTPTEPTGSTHSLSPLDYLTSPHTVHIIFYYRNSPFVKKGRFAMDLDNVRISLSELLSKYPRMTGRLVVNETGNWDVKYNDAGIRMFKADVGATVDEWLRFADEVDERNLTVWDDMPDGDPTWSPFRIQVNEFVGGGLAIGLSFTHLLSDPTGAALFFKSWTDVDRGEPMAQHPPLFTLPNLDTRPPPHTPENASTAAIFYEKKSKLTRNPSIPMASSTFKFSHTIIAQRLSKITNVTPFDYLAALFWSRIIKLRPPVGPTTTHTISVCIDMRRQFGVPIPNKFFGNAVHFSQLSLDDETLTGDNGVAEAARLVNRHVTGVKKEDVLAAVDWMETSRKGPNGEYPKPVQMYGPEITCVSMEHLVIPDEPEALVYNAKFRKNEKPVHVSCHVGNVAGEGVIIVMPSPEGGLGRAVTVTLPKEQIGKLYEDLVISDLEPTMILSGIR